MQPERSQTGAGVPARTLVVAFATLVVPLVAIAAFALGAPMPPRPAVTPAVVPAEPPTEIEAALPVEELPATAPPAAADPPPAALPVVPQPLNPFPRWTREERPTFLVLGIDRRPDEQLYRTDSILLANADLAAGRGTVISVPRDLVVNIPGYYADRVNAVYALGESEKPPGGGLALLRETIERNFGVRVDHHVVVDFSCFRGAVDALGGVQISVPERIYDPYYPTEDYGYKVVRFETGPQWLNGERALEYARTRYGDTDFGRMRRQQQLLTALKARALQVQSLGALPQVAGACGGMASDLSMLDLIALGASARDIRQSDITLRVIDERMAIPYIAPSGAAVLLPRWEEIRAMVRATMPPGRPGLTAASPSAPGGRLDEAAPSSRGSLVQSSGRLTLE